MTKPINPYIRGPLPVLPDGLTKYTETELRKLEVVIAALIADNEEKDAKIAAIVALLAAHGIS